MQFSPVALLRKALVLCVSAGLFAQAQSASLPSKEDLAETTAWFDSMKWPDLAGKPFVEFTFGRWEYEEGKFADGPKRRGFLVAEDNTEFTLFSFDLEEHESYLALTRIPKSDPADPPEIRITRRVVELDAVADGLLTKLQRVRDQSDKWWMVRGRKLSNHAAVFIFARFCARAGRKDLAKRLDAELLALDDSIWLDDPELSCSSFRDGIESQIARALMWGAIEDCGDAKMTRLQMLAQFERILRDFPASQYHAQASGFAEMLRMMVAEDEAHELATRPFDTMSEEEKVRELIFRLRDQRSLPESPTGGWDKDSPAEQLVKLGHVAVPALIETLGDERLTRFCQPSMANAFDFDSICTVGQCAQRILGSISGRSLDREGAVSWWKNLQVKGENHGLKSLPLP
jgi:hypothetical protein